MVKDRFLDLSIFYVYNGSQTKFWRTGGLETSLSKRVFFIFNPFLFNILIIIAPKKFYRLDPLVALVPLARQHQSR
jgi:hypothetical protein